MGSSLGFRVQRRRGRPERVAVLDLGTNTFHLLIADITDRKQLVILHHETIAVKLGEASISEGKISSIAFARGIAAINKFKESLDLYQVSTVKSAATSAIRSASNGAEFVRKINALMGLNIEIIDGEREAELIYFGVRAAVPIQCNTLIVDIGGGSVEFIICDKDSLLWKKSYPAGAARMMERFHHSDPILEEEIARLHSYLDDSLSELKTQIESYTPVLMIGSAGSFETFAELQGNGLQASFEKPEMEIDLARFAEISDLILSSNHVQREAIPEIPPVRVDMIVVSTLITNYILKLSRVSALKLSAYSLKEGLLFEMLK